MNGKLARARSTDRNDATAAFVKALYEASGYATWKELADAAGVSAPQVSDFQTGKVEPAGGNLLDLIEAAASRTGSDATTFAMRIARESFADQLAMMAARLQAVEGLISATGATANDHLDKLTQKVQLLDDRLAAAFPQAKKGRGR